jgi:hypothetical protein
MKVLALFFFYFGLAFWGTLTTETAVLGEWLAPAMRNSVVTIYRASDGLFYGKIIASDQKEWVGEVVLEGLRYEESEKIWTGKINSLSPQIQAAAELSIAPNGKLKVVGTKFFVSETYYWTKV